MTHTRGPWTVSEGWIFASADSRLPNYSNRGADIPLFKECHATLPGDLKLAAAAPDLLAALEKARSWVAVYENMPGHDAAARAMLAVISAAIRKAKGE